MLRGDVHIHDPYFLVNVDWPVIVDIVVAMALIGAIVYWRVRAK